MRCSCRTEKIGDVSCLVPGREPWGPAEGLGRPFSLPGVSRWHGDGCRRRPADTLLRDRVCGAVEEEEQPEDTMAQSRHRSTARDKQGRGRWQEMPGWQAGWRKRKKREGDGDSVAM